MFQALHDTDPAERIVHLGIRADLPSRGTLDAVLDRLDTLASDGRLGGYDVTSWPAHVRFDVEPATDSVLDRFERFWTWAESEGLSITPAFGIRQGRTMLGEYEQVLDTPVVFAWVTVDGEIRAVAPCADGSETATLMDLIGELEAEAVGSSPRLVSA